MDYRQMPDGQAQYTQAPNSQMQYTQAPNGQPQYTQAPSGQPQYTQVPYQQMPSGQPQYTQVPYQQMPNGQAQYTQAPYQQMPNGQMQYAQMPYAQPQSNKAAFSVLKLIGLIIAVAGLVYKVVYNITYFDSIKDWWHGSIWMYFAMYVTSAITIVSALLRRTGALVLSISIMALSFVLLLVDGILFLGFAATLSTYSMIELGIAPLVNILNCIASVFILIGAVRSKK